MTIELNVKYDYKAKTLSISYDGTKQMTFLFTNVEPFEISSYCSNIIEDSIEMEGI